MTTVRIDLDELQRVAEAVLVNRMPCGCPVGPLHQPNRQVARKPFTVKPETVLALIARLRAAETQRDEAARLLRDERRCIGKVCSKGATIVDAFLARVDGEQTT